jgi:uncharacterized SAM-binding protein YcdF (DUF218 family)
MEGRKHVKRIKHLFLPAVLLILAAVCFWGPPGYDFSGWICVGITGICCMDRWLRLKKNKKWAVICKRLLAAGLILGIILAAVTLGFILGGAAPADEAYDYMIVLGAGVHGTTPSMILSERIEAAHDYLTAHPDTIAVLSGGQGHGEEITEAKCMFDSLVARGIDPQRLWLEEQSTSTWENLRFSLAIMEEKTGSRPQRIGLVSNEFHLYRACLVAQEHGVQAGGIPARTEWVSLRVNYYLREIAAMWKYLLLGGN